MQTDLTTQQLQQTLLDCLADNYGLQGSLKRLGGENLNFLVTTLTGDRYVFKIVDDDMPPEVVEMEFKAIEHAISAGIALKFPKIIQNQFGNIETGIKIHKNSLYRARLLSFVGGDNFEDISDISDVLLQNLGKSMAEFDLAMQDFDHPAARRNHRFNLAQAGQHRDKVRLVASREQRDLLNWAFDTWEQRAACHFHELPHQFIHGDFNRGNVLVRDGRVTGLVDFGDSCFNPAVCELAICLSYIMMDHPDPLQAASIVSGSYERLRPLSAVERSVLFPLICGRLAVSISVAAERSLIDPHHPSWFVSQKRAWVLLPGLREFVGA